MSICEENHEQCVYEGRECPACKKQETIDELKQDVKRLEQEVKALEDAQEG